MAVSIQPKHDDRGALFIGDGGSLFTRKIYLANPTDRDSARHNFVFYFGACAPTYVRAWGREIDDALQNAADWLEKYAPGHFADDLVSEAYAEAKAEGLEDDAAAERAEADVTLLDCGHSLLSFEWGIALESPTRAQLLAFLFPP